MATGLPWAGELDALKRGVDRLIGVDTTKSYLKVEYPPDEEGERHVAT